MLFRSEMKQPFVPTHDNARDLATMFGLFAVIGKGMGSGFMKDAQLSMSAMNGMMQGYQQGRMDLYKKEKDQFDESQKSLKNRFDALSKKMEKVAELAKTDMQSADQEFDAAALEQGAEFLKQYKEKRVLAKGLDYVKELNNAFYKNEELKLKQEELGLKRKEVEAKLAGGVGGAVPKDTATNNEHRFRQTAMRDRKSTRLNSSHIPLSRMPSSA